MRVHFSPFYICVSLLTSLVCRKSGFILPILMDHPRDVLLELALEDSKCTKVNVQRVFLEYMKPNAERDLWDYMEPEPEEADKTIFESLEIANYLDLGPVISILCRCIARVINTMCADTAAIRERFQMQEQDSLFTESF